ncbi:MAG TPA: CpaF family protein [Firmicutes bacterium]|nr:CpaF family protein [Candidatus Fermentithermobacillaceae bacterium]
MSLIKKLESAPYRTTGNVKAARERSLEDVIETVRERILESHADLVMEARVTRSKRNEVLALVSEVIVSGDLYVSRLTRKDLAERIVQELCGLGPIDEFLDDPGVTEIMVNGPNDVYIERDGVIQKTPVRFAGEQHVLELINRIVGSAGRRVDKSSPYVDARLPDGSRVNAVIPPLSLSGPVLTIRRFPRRYSTLDELVSLGTVEPRVAEFLKTCVETRLDIVVSGGSGTGKTTTLNVLANLSEKSERVIVIEDSSELRLSLDHVIYLQTRPESVEGKGRVTVRDLLRNALRMRPDRIIIGECRGAETFDLISAMNTGHEGCMSTVHANSTRDCLSRLTAMSLMAQESVPLNVLESWIGSAVDVIVQQARASGGARRIVEVSLVGVSDGTLRLATVYDSENRRFCKELPAFFSGKVRKEVAERLEEAVNALVRGDAP